VSTSPRTPRVKLPPRDGNPGKTLFLDIAESICREIQRKELKPHTRLPSEPELTRRYGVARATIRRALAKLQHDGLIYSRRAAGSFVAEPHIEQDLDQLFSFTEFMTYRGFRPGTRLLIAEKQQIREPHSHLLHYLALRPGAKVWHLRRLRLGGGQPLVVANTWLPAHLFEDLLENDLAKTSIYEIMSAAGYKPTDAVQTMEATALESEEAALLRVKPGSPAFLIRRVGYASGIPVECAVDYYRGDCTRFRVRLGVLEHRVSKRIERDDITI
jgi:GntR family transcriptional regulator